MLAQVLQIFLGKEHLVKNQLIFTLDKVIYVLQRSNFSAVFKTSLHFTKWGGDQLKKFSLFSNRLFLA
jgi:hypothetical protein